MNRLEELYAEKKVIEQQKVNSMASSVMRRQKLNKVEREIKYYEQGNEISRHEIQQQLTEIDELQQRVNQLSAQLANKKSVLMDKVFGEGAELLKN